jgi:hypothetical protein
MNNSIEIIEELSTPVKMDLISASATCTSNMKRTQDDSNDDEICRPKEKKFY